MKIFYIYITLFVVTTFNNNVRASENKESIIPIKTFMSDTLINQLSLLNLTEYNGKPVDTLLYHLPAGYIEMKITGWRSLKIAEILYVIYPNNIEVAIHVRNFQFMNPHLVNTNTPKQNWNITQFRKEQISFTVIFNGSTCINGCENEFK